MNFLKNIKFLILPVLGLGLALQSQLSFQSDRIRAPEQETLSLPAPERARFMFPGQESFASSIYWIQTIFRYSDVLVNHADPEILGHLVELVTTLDPLWQYPFEYGSLIITDRYGKPTRETLELLENGVTRFPDAWLLRLFWVVRLQEFDTGLDSVGLADSCARILEPISKGSIDAPEFARTLSFTIVQKSGRPAEALNRLFALYPLIKDPVIRTTYRRKILKIIETSIPFPERDMADLDKIFGDILDTAPEEQLSAFRMILVHGVENPERVNLQKALSELLRENRRSEGLAP